MTKFMILLGMTDGTFKNANFLFHPPINAISKLMKVGDGFKIQSSDIKYYEVIF